MRRFHPESYAEGADLLYEFVQHLHDAAWQRDVLTRQAILADIAAAFEKMQDDTRRQRESLNDQLMKLPAWPGVQ